MKLEDLFTRRRPGRASALTRLQRCAGSLLLDDEDLNMAVSDDRNRAADTGTAFHRMAELFHEDPLRPLSDIVEQVAEEAEGGAGGRHPFRLADVGQAEQWLERYVVDPRNCDAEVEHQELKVRLEVEVDDDEPVVVTGHVDQVRVGAGGLLEVWDVKTGRGDAASLTFEYAWQQAAYVLGAREVLGEPVRPGGLILPRAYLTPQAKKKPAEEARAFSPTPWGVDACREMMRQAAAIILRMRRGMIDLNPGPQCRWCPGASPACCGEDLRLLFEELSRQ